MYQQYFQIFFGLSVVDMLLGENPVAVSIAAATLVVAFTAALASRVQVATCGYGGASLNLHPQAYHFYECCDNLHAILGRYGRYRLYGRYGRYGVV